jgi:hypothetical protein
MANRFPRDQRERVCQRVIDSLANPFMWNEKTGEEDRDCPPTTPSPRTRQPSASLHHDLQATAFKCLAAPIAVPPCLEHRVQVVGQQNWTVKTGNVS